ncbi:Protein of unknown function [Pyronema omphalodes CBS 100304]|uniref:Uncharacterized protein n=1 Tax=Pyronema omphalodes (strain CBS 100304) TaxID=1076935 RepID=U4LWD8_PYROM|nr:Protein of unknown function [Pyronema omphalodes CBS 100304]
MRGHRVAKLRDLNIARQKGIITWRYLEGFRSHERRRMREESFEKFHAGLQGRPRMLFLRCLTKVV